MGHAADVRSVDVIVIGAGMAGVSIAYELAAEASVLVLEQEDVLAKHTTGRSAAAFLEWYGSPLVRSLTRASRSAYDAAPDALGTPELLSPRPMLLVGRADQESSLDQLVTEVGGTLVRVAAAEAIALCPALDPSYVACAAVDQSAMDIDVMALHQGYVAGLARRNGSDHSAVNASSDMRPDGDGWRVRTADEEIIASTVVNAAGAWADEVAVSAGLEPIGLQPLRRTIAICAGTRDDEIATWPLVVDADGQFYFKPETGRDFLVSPGDTTPVAPHDARPQDEDIALGLERVNAATTLGLRHVRTAWAGLRTFAPDSNPVVGEDPRAKGFFWFAGQGGYGIQMAPRWPGSVRRCCAASCRSRSCPASRATLCPSPGCSMTRSTEDAHHGVALRRQASRGRRVPQRVCADGDWARLFGTADGFLGTELFRSDSDPHRFITVDTWSDVAAWEEFRRQRAEEYAALDERCAAYTIAEERLA